MAAITEVHQRHWEMPKTSNLPYGRTIRCVSGWCGWCGCVWVVWVCVGGVGVGGCVGVGVCNTCNSCILHTLILYLNS